jgi:hypothetical protein
MRTLIRNNFCSTIKSIFFSILKIFSIVEIQKLNVCACLTRLIKPDKKTIFFDYFGGKFDQDTGNFHIY